MDCYSRHFAETIFADQEFRIYDILIFRERNFRGLLGSAKTAKITRLENLEVYDNTNSYQTMEKHGVADTNFIQETLCDLVTLLTTNDVVQQLWITVMQFTFD